MTAGKRAASRATEIIRSSARADPTAMPSQGSHRAFLNLGGVEGGVEHAEVKEHFSSFGSVKDVYFPVDKATGRSKRIAFVTFETAEALEACLGSRHTIRGNVVEVERAAARPDSAKKSNAPRSSGKSTSMPMGAGLPYVGTGVPEHPVSQSSYMQGFLAAQRMMTGGPPLFLGVPPGMPPVGMMMGGFHGGGQDMHLHAPAGGRGNASGAHAGKKVLKSTPRFRVFCKGVPDSLTEGSMLEHFSQYGQVIDVYIPTLKGGAERRGIAFVAFQREDDVERALLGGVGQSIEDAMVQVSRAEDRGKPDTPDWEAGVEHSKEKFPRRDAYERPQEASERIFVGGMHLGITESHVRETFRQFGEVRDVYFPKDSATGSARGFCYITFSSSDGVQRAIQGSPKTVAGMSIGDVRVAEARPQSGIQSSKWGGHADRRSLPSNQDEIEGNYAYGGGSMFTNGSLVEMEMGMGMGNFRDWHGGVFDPSMAGTSSGEGWQNGTYGAYDQGYSMHAPRGTGFRDAAGSRTLRGGASNAGNGGHAVFRHSPVSERFSPYGPGYGTDRGPSSFISAVHARGGGGRQDFSNLL